MSGIVVGTLTIDLKAETASFSQAMDKTSQLAAKTANDIKRSLEKIAAAGAAMGAAIATGTGALIKSALDTAEGLGELAQSTGTTVETLSTLAYAAKLTGVETDKLGVGLERLSRAALAAQGGNIQLERIFSRLGVSVADSNGHLKDSGVLMGEIAQKFSQVSDGAGKTAIATTLFGRSGATLIPMLDEYGAHQAEINAQAHQFGLALNTSTTQAAKEAQEKLRTLTEVLQGIGFAVLGSTLPALNQLGDKLIQVAANADIPDLAKAFGQRVITVVTDAGKAFDFAAQHAEALKVAIEGLAGLTALKIAIPVISDLQAGGFANVGKGIDRLTVGLLGLQRTLPALSKMGETVSTAAKGFYGAAEGLSIGEVAVVGLSQGFGKLGESVAALKDLSFASIFGTLTSSFSALKDLSLASVFSSLASGFELIATAAANAGKAILLAALSNPWTIAAAAIAGVAVAAYEFRDSILEIQGQTYELRDVFSAGWILIKEGFEAMVKGLRDAWSAFIGWFDVGWMVNAFRSAFSEVAGFAEKILGSLTPKFVVDALDQAKRARESASAKPSSPSVIVPAGSAKPQLSTEGLGTPKRDIYGDEIRQLNQAIASERAYLAVLDGAPEQIEAVAAAEKARATILELNNRLTDEGRPKLTAHQQAMIWEAIATDESLKALDDYGKKLVEETRSAQLAVAQTHAMAAANLEGDEAVRTATVDNAILGLTYNRTAAQIAAMAPELAKVRTELTARGNAEVVSGANKEIYNLQQELVQRQLVTAATLDSVDAQRQADLASKLYSLDQQIATTADSAAREALEQKRQAMVELADAENAQADAQAARGLLSPADQYGREMDSLNHAVEALKSLQNGTLTYGEELQIAAKQQEAFNQATDQTVELLLREGSLSDGVTAFFLKMQEQAKTTASTIYDVLNETFSKLADNFTALITAPNRWSRQKVEGQFGQTFEDAGKTLLDNTIKQQTQRGIGALGKVLGIQLPVGNGKPDGSTSANALWVRLASASGSPVTGKPGSETGAETGAERAAAPASGSPAAIFDNVTSQFFAGNELERMNVVPRATNVTGQIPAPPGGNELEDLLGPAPAVSAEPLSPGVQSPGVQSPGIQLPQSPAGVQSGAQSPGSAPSSPGLPSLGVPSAAIAPLLAPLPAQTAQPILTPSTSSPSGLSVTAVGDFTSDIAANAQRRGGATGIFGTVLSGLASSLFGIRRRPIPQQQPAAVLSGETLGLPSSAVSFFGGNELNDLSGGKSPSSNPISLTNWPNLPNSSSGNELEDLSRSPASPVQSIPQLLLNAPATAELPNVVPTAPNLIPEVPLEAAAPLPPVQSIPQQLLNAPGESSLPPTTASAPPPEVSSIPQALALAPSGAGLTAGETSPGNSIPAAPDVESGNNTQITRPGRSLADQIADTGIGFAAKLAPLFFARGGRIAGPGTGTSDSIPARLSHGEYVINAASTAKHLGLLHAINNGVRFAFGGPVGFDDGGLVSPSVAYMPAQRTPAMFSAASSSVTSGAPAKSQQSGDTHTWNIDARGSTDPAQTTAQLDRYMRSAAPRIAAMAVGAMKEQQKRLPSMSR